MSNCHTCKVTLLSGFKVSLKTRGLGQETSKVPYIFSEMGFIIQPTIGGLLWCAVNIWVALPIKASAFFRCLIYRLSSSAQTATWNLCHSSNDTVFVVWIIFCHPLNVSLYIHSPNKSLFYVHKQEQNFYFCRWKGPRYSTVSKKETDGYNKSPNV